MKRVMFVMSLGFAVVLTSCGGTAEEESTDDDVVDIEEMMDDLLDEDVSDSDLDQDDFICVWEYAGTDGEDLEEDDLEFFGDWSYLSMPRGSGGADWYAGYYEFDGDVIIMDEGVDAAVLSVDMETLELEIDGEVREYIRIEETEVY